MRGPFDLAHSHVDARARSLSLSLSLSRSLALSLPHSALSIAGDALIESGEGEGEREVGGRPGMRGRARPFQHYPRCILRETESQTESACVCV